MRRVAVFVVLLMAIVTLINAYSTASEAAETYEVSSASIELDQ